MYNDYSKYPEQEEPDPLQSPDELNEQSINELGEEDSVIKTTQDIIDEFNFEPQELNSLAFPEYSEEETKILMERYAAQFKSINQQKEIPDKFYPGYQYQELFSYMSKEYSLTLLQSEMDEIIGIAKRFNAGNNTGESEGVEEKVTREIIKQSFIDRLKCYYNTDVEDSEEFLFYEQGFADGVNKYIEPLQKEKQTQSEIIGAAIQSCEDLQNIIMNQERKIIELEKENNLTERQLIAATSKIELLDEQVAEQLQTMQELSKENEHFKNLYYHECNK